MEPNNNIIIDTREPEKLFEKIKLLDNNCVRETLLIGDFLISNKNICIERKEIMDFVGSYISNHLQEQLNNMQINYDVYYLFISGSYNYLRFKKSFYKHLKEESINKMKIHLLNNYPGLRIVEFSNDNLLLKGVVELAKYEGRQKTDFLVKKKYSCDDVFFNILCCVPNISVIKAQKIMHRYKTLNELKTNLPVLDIKGISKKDIENLIQTFL